MIPKPHWYRWCFPLTEDFCFVIDCCQTQNIFFLLRTQSWFRNRKDISFVLEPLTTSSDGVWSTMVRFLPAYPLSITSGFWIWSVRDPAEHSIDFQINFNKNINFTNNQKQQSCQKFGSLCAHRCYSTTFCLQWLFWMGCPPRMTIMVKCAAAEGEVLHQVATENHIRNILLECLTWNKIEIFFFDLIY